MASDQSPPRVVAAACDGACSGNPGPGGWGSLLRFEDGSVQEFGAADPATVLHSIAAIRRDRGSRRRMTAGRVVGPVIVLAVGAIVLFQALAVFVPLMDIIHALL